MSSSSSTTKMSGRSGADAESTGGATDSAGRRIRLRLLNSVQKDVLVTRGIVGTIWAECCANVSQLLMNDEFRAENSARRLFLGHMPQALALDQAVEIFSKIGRVVTGSF